MPPTVNSINAQELWSKINSGESCQIVDVREPAEYRSEHISGSVSLPLSSLDPKKIKLDRNRSAYLLCRAGKRAQKAADMLAESGVRDLVVINGGLLAWQEAGCPIEQGGGGAWSLERQVRFTAGLLIFLGTILAFTVNIGWLLLPALVSGGMMFSAATDVCGMAMLLAKMPWNRG